ncbi:hypothetical protein HK098_000365, partial [Nowakowskiella sp. JEL0407]
MRPRTKHKPSTSNSASASNKTTSATSVTSIKNDPELSVIGTQFGGIKQQSQAHTQSQSSMTTTAASGAAAAMKSKHAGFGDGRDEEEYEILQKKSVEFEVDGDGIGSGEKSRDLDGDDEGEGRTRALGKSEFRTAQRFSANRAWAGAIVAPSDFNENSTAMSDLPRQTLELEHIYGYRVRDCRNNLFYLNSNQIVYPAGAVGVVHDIKQNKQQFFRARHKEDIVCIAVHPSHKLVATGDIVCHDDGCYIYMWDPFSPHDEKRQIQIRVGEKKLGKGVADVEFSPDGRWLVAVGMDADHMVYLFDWQKRTTPVVKEKGHSDS